MLILNYYKMKNLMVRKFAIILAAVLGIQMAAAAQGLTVSGSVTDETGYPLEGATVMIRGTMNGTITDADGLYRIDVKPDEEIIVSYLGYLSQTRKVNGQATINFTLLEDTNFLEDVIVVAYGTMSESDFTGSASQIKGEKIGRQRNERKDCRSPDII